VRTAAMRWVTLVLFACLALLQWPLWFGERSWPQVEHLKAALRSQQQANDAAAAANQALEDQARDLRQAPQAVQDRARSDMGMVRPDEIYVQVLPASSPMPPVASAPR